MTQTSKLLPTSDGYYTQMPNLHDEVGLDEVLPVNAFNARLDDWTKQGTSPYLDVENDGSLVKENRYNPATEQYLSCTGEQGSNAWDTVGSSPYCQTAGDGNEIKTKTDGAESYEFIFEDSVVTEEIKDVHLYIYAYQEGTQEQIEIWIWDDSASAWVHLQDSSPNPSPNGPAYADIDVDVSSLISSWSEVNAFKCKFVYVKSGKADYVHIDRLRLRVRYATYYRSGDYDFQNSSKTDTILKSILEVNGKRDSTNGFTRVYIWTGTAWQSYDFLFDLSYSWKTVDMGLILGTWAKVNGAKIYLEYVGQTTPYPFNYVEASRLRIKYTPNTHFDKVDEDPADDSATYVYTSTSDGSDYIDTYHKTPHGLGSITVNWLRVYIRIRTSLGIGGGHGWARTFLRSGTTDAQGILVYSANWGEFYTEHATDPNTGSAWTPAAADAAEIGVKARSTYDAKSLGYMVADCTQTYAIIDYSEIVGPLIQYSDGLVTVIS